MCGSSSRATSAGSGGFARAMDETVRAGQSAYVLLMDDDVKLEPEGILRAVTFADLARKPTIVGGHMFSLHDRSLLHAYAEAIGPYKWWWGPAPNTLGRHDFGRRNLRNTPWLHRRADSDYNGWWMCLIPTRSSRRSGSRCRSSSSGTTPSTACAPAATAIRRCPCLELARGRCRGTTRMMPGTGGPTITCATGS